MTRYMVFDDGQEYGAFDAKDADEAILFAVCSFERCASAEEMKE